MTITKTTNYDIFKRVKGNRPVDVNHVKSLISSVAQKNLLENIPLIVNDRMEVIDGQHRLEVSKAMSIPVYYIKVPHADIKDIRRLNSYSRPWSVYDYLESYIDLGKNDYKILKAFANKYGMSISIASIILNNPNGEKHRRTTIQKEYKTGEFQVEDLGKSELLARHLQDLKPYLEDGVDKDREFIVALMEAYNTVSQLEFMEQFREYKTKIQKRARVKDYLRQLEDVANNGTRREVRL
jgi:hypothetical protein